MRRRPSSRGAAPHRMPPQTYWRPETPTEGSPSLAPAATSTEQDPAVEPIEAAPDVTAPEWVDWVEQSVRQSRAHEPPPGPSWPVTDPLADEPAAVGGATPRQDRTGPGPEAWDDQPRHARLTVLGVAAAAVLAVLLSVGAWWWVGRDDDEVQRADGPRAATEAAAAPTSPVALSPGAEHTQVRILGSGDLAVEQWIYGAHPLTGLAVAPPSLPAGTGTVRVSHLTVVAGSRPVQVPAELDGPSRLTFSPAQTVYLSYTLGGVLERDGTSGRALARATSLTVSYDRGADPATIAFRGATLLSLACTPLTGDAVPVPCGEADGSRGWRVVLPATEGAVQVMAQLDLEQTG